MSKHTPGPWALKHYTDLRGDSVPDKIVNASGLPVVASCLTLTSAAGEPLANARLIAAAPELVAALRDCMDCIDSLHSGDGSLLYQRRLVEIDALLARIDGEA